ncbi:MAG: hypothetical protein IAE79_27460 [Anaerolinea sp.]|nr:hypothetical protein [Anaerolinea sp.]
MSDQLEAVEQVEPELEAVEVPRGLQHWLNQTIWQRIPLKYRQNFEPEVLRAQLLEGEQQQIEVKLAWYRELLANIVFGYFIWWFIAAVILTVILLISPLNHFIAIIPFATLFLVMIEAARELLEYKQWRLIKTNKRLIISLPERGSWPLVDNIEMGDLPKVLDTNWSPNPVWRLFQFFTGARDVYISLTAFKFEKGTARVLDAIVIPDIMPGEVFKLKQLVFGKK